MYILILHNCFYVFTSSDWSGTTPHKSLKLFLWLDELIALLILDFTCNNKTQ